MNEGYHNLKEFIDLAALRKDMQRETAWVQELTGLLGEGAVFMDADTIAAHSFDAWPVAAKWKQQNKRLFMPDVVVKIRNAEQISRLLVWAGQKMIPVIPWGGGSSVTGQPLATRGGISLDTTAMDKVIEVDDEALTVTVEAGIFGFVLEKKLNELGFTLNHSPQSLFRSTVGGWISTRATGQFSSRYGGIEELIVSLTVVLPTGEIIETLDVPRASFGPDLRHIFMGAEGTLGVVAQARMKIFPLAEFRIFEAFSFDSVKSGLTVLRKIARLGLKPLLARFYDFEEAKHAMVDPAFSSCVMFLGFEGPQAVAVAEYETALALCTAEGGKMLGPAPVEAWMERRFNFSTVENILHQSGGIAETIEIAHFWNGIEEVYYRIKEALAPYADEVLGHFSHIYPQGVSLYIILLGRTLDDAHAEDDLLAVWDISMRICLKHGAALSHHHGAGLARMPYFSEGMGSSMLILKKIKQAIDPGGIMNPDKLGLTGDSHNEAQSPSAGTS